MASKLKLRKKKYHPPIEARNDDNTIRQDLNLTTNMTIVERAIASAQKHSIKQNLGEQIMEMVTAALKQQLSTSMIEVASRRNFQ